MAKSRRPKALTAEELETVREMIAGWKRREEKQRFKYEGGETAGLNIRIPKGLREELEAEAKVTGFTLSEIVRDRLEQGRR